MNKYSKHRGSANDRRVRKGAAALAIVFAMMAGIIAPGCSRNRGGGEEDIPDPFIGHSAAFSVNAAEGLRISAEANALDRDRTFTVTDPSDTDYDEICTGFESLGVIPWRVFEVDAGLADNEEFPGVYQMDFDLRTLGVPEDAYPKTSAWRVGADGSFSELSCEIQGDMLIATSSRNSFIVLGSVVVWAGGISASAVGSFFGASAYIGHTEKWSSMGSHYMLSEMSSNNLYRVYYDAAYSDMGKQLSKTVLDSYAAAIERADREIRESGAYNNRLARWFAKETKVWTYTRNNATMAAEFQLNDPTSEFRRNPDNIPPAVTLVKAYLDECHKYLESNIGQGLKARTNVTDILLCKNLGDLLGCEVNPTVGDPYVILNNAEIDVNNAMKRANLKLTIVHELAHVFQTRYSTVDWNTNIVFWEATAIVVEKQARDHMSLDDTPPLTPRNYFETLSVSMGTMGEGPRIKTNSGDTTGSLLKLGEKSGQVNGYTLGGFILYLEDKLGDAAHVFLMLNAFKAGKNFSACIAAGLNATVNDIPGHFVDFCRANAAAMLERHRYVRQYNDGYTELLYNPAPLDANRQSVYADVLRDPMTAVVREFRVNRNSVGGQYALLICADPLNSNLADWQWCAMRLSPDSVGTPMGVFYKVRRDPSIYMLEVNYFLNQAHDASRYQAILFVPPDYPRVSFSEDNKFMIIKLPEDDSEAFRQEKIDGYRITIESSDGKVTTKHIPVSQREAPVSLRVASLTNQRVSEDSGLESVDWDVSVCQYIHVRGQQYVYGPESSGGGSGLSEAELEESLLDANAQTGVITISLGWQTSDDVDLHVVTPGGNEIYYGDRSYDTGTLDVDANASSIVSNPVENIYFTDPPAGTYRVFIEMYRNRNEGAAAAYIVRVKIGNETQVFRGSIASDGSRAQIITFTYNGPDVPPDIVDIPATEAPSDRY